MRESAKESTEAYIDPLKMPTWTLTQSFQKNGYANLTDLFTDKIKKDVKQEVLSLLKNYSQRRDVIVEETGNTPRYLSNVIHSDIVENGNVIPSMYFGTTILRLLENIVSDKVYLCPYEPEQLLISRQEFSRDTHGWHWGDYSYALIWIINAPVIEIGGLLQCIPHTRWDKQNPRINEHLVNNLIQSYLS